MAELFRWSGNDTTRYSINDHLFDHIIDFARKGSEIYLFGAGRIGSGMKVFLEDSGITVKDIFVSSRREDMMTAGADAGARIIVSLGDQYIDDVLPLISGAFAKDNILIPSAVVRNEIGSIYSKDDLRAPEKKKFWINVYVTNKCNLACRSCSALAPICKTPDFYEPEMFKQDMKRIKELAFHSLRAFEFTGAEAMLHPDIMEMLSYARELFPDIRLQLYSNGVFFLKCGVDILEQLSKLKVIVTITEYPLEALRIKDVYKRFDEYNVDYFVIYAEGQKYFSKRPLHFDGNAEKHAYIYCPRYRTFKSLFLFRGRLYKCIYSLSAKYISEAFHREVKAADNDSISIYEKTAEEIYDFDIHRIPFCRYCAPIEEKVPWGISEKKIEEWT